MLKDGPSNGLKHHGGRHIFLDIMEGEMAVKKPQEYHDDR